MMEDLLGAMQMGSRLQSALGGNAETAGQEQLLEVLGEKLQEQRGASQGSTLGINLIEGEAGNGAPRGLGNAFKLDVLAQGSIAPGFTGSLPVSRLALHTGEFASEGLAPMLYIWEPGKPGSVSLSLFSYDGERLRGRVDAQLPAAEGIQKIGGGRPVTRFSAEFDAGAFNPLRMENVCLMSQALAAEAP
jgi:hypothetical protein